MEVHTDFTSGKHTLVFDSGKRVELTKGESDAFEQWHRDKRKEQNHEAILD